MEIDDRFVALFALAKRKGNLMPEKRSVHGSDIKKFSDQSIDASDGDVRALGRDELLSLGEHLQPAKQTESKLGK
ncbi:hypothetical protein [Caballeronia zhejiangensis]|jgi:hypothetical protein|uniref:hypothetical protein n=1 Tax=Caballeronia zhejiangensis TaxID=871203 RepID=UPI001FD3E7EB|nr:hypothetical protein [Caballeronia zhejiangensis]